MDDFSESYKYNDHNAVFAHREAGSHTSCKAKPSVHLSMQIYGPAYFKQDAAVQMCRQEGDALHLSFAPFFRFPLIF